MYLVHSRIIPECFAGVSSQTLETIISLCCFSVIAPIVQEAKPFYTYLQSLRNISGQLEGTDVVLDGTQQTQQVCPFSICMFTQRWIQGFSEDL